MRDKDRGQKGKGASKGGKPSGRSAPSAPLRAGASRATSRPTPKPRPVSEERESRPVKPRPEKAVEREAEAQVVLSLREGEKPGERVPVILETKGSSDYHLIDSGHGLKLEQYGPYRIVRPEAQALWPPLLPAHVWEKADAVFTGDTDEDGIGRWRFPKEALGETWPMRILDADFYGRFTAFRHVGVFPEQLAHWSWMKNQVETAGRPLKVLNLFGYTGVASLIAAKAGAEVTHVDASKKAIGWARENQALGRAESLPIRWICEDAMKFIQREARRGSRYDIILTDPPKFGRGPNGEVWQLFDHLAQMLDICRDILSPEARGLVLTAYSIRASFYSIHELMRDTMRGRGGVVESGELILREGGLDGRAPARALSTSLFSRWVPK
ncbi:MULTISPECIES: class I SAM-dependent rRNA methyltransferase [unclassified Rhizobium]|uniref:class I SAM-dependent rRNA methyltransferase n=1 Tax=unclassified Rhizobium TaxID=2613769 RepID=UPI0006F5F98E|nr:MULTISPECIES: class I SAM-dependent rRNA methyltransferase [unclassified Rhizobium]KQV44220.1 SAM-dependent methyltransferase [Rhizobium sp. Root1212]KRD38401.1 SAM-dependent methyltransferase [Rhizobium sp. Root268]